VIDELRSPYFLVLSCILGREGVWALGVFPFLSCSLSLLPSFRIFAYLLLSSGEDCKTCSSSSLLLLADAAS
jgi:hypothetical protein